MRPSRPAGVLLLALTVLLTTSCSSQQDGSATAAQSPAASPTTPPTTPATTGSPTPRTTSATMVISGFEYAVPESVGAGEPVTVVNQDREAHTVTVDGGAIRLTVLPGATAVFTAPSGAGDHRVTCDLHGGMDAVLVVA